MSSKRRRSALRLTPDEISDLLLKLQALLPDSSSSCTSKVTASKILEETCNYIKMLHIEVDDLSEKLSQKLASVDSNINVVDRDTFRSLLQLYSRNHNH